MILKSHSYLLSKIEIRIFLLSFIGYWMISLLFAVNTQLVFNVSYICDLYLGYDNAGHDTSFLRHPLLKLFSICFNFLANTINNTLVVSIIISTICSFILAIQNLFLYKILRNILVVTKQISLTIVLMYAFCGYNLLLSFTLDSYLFSTTALMAFFYLFWKYDMEQRIIPSWLYFTSVFVIAGLTVTNLVKTIILSFGTCIGSIRSIYIKRLAALSFILALPMLYFYEKTLTAFTFVTTYFGQYEDLWNNVFNYFFGSIFLIPNITVRESTYINGETFNNAVGAYQCDLGFLLLAMIALLFTYISIKHFKHKIVKILLLCLGVDFFINVILGLGLSEAYIFPGNYQFVFPLLLGVYLKGIKTSFYYYTIVALVLFGLIYFNFNQLFSLYQFGIHFHPYKEIWIFFNN